MIRKWICHAIMECQDCDWNSTDYTVATDKAREHHKKTGHRIHGETGYAVRIGGDGDD